MTTSLLPSSIVIRLQCSEAMRCGLLTLESKDFMTTGLPCTVGSHLGVVLMIPLTSPELKEGALSFMMAEGKTSEME